jgi:peptidoglycan/LPS O-acetylase OafA/YrhL
MGRERVPQLDGLRGIAISLVLLFHYDGLDLEVLRPIASRGWIGVDLFFVMSGFLIGGIIIDNKDSQNLFRVFYIRRFLRIFPLYYLLLISVLVLPWPHDGIGFYFLYIQNNLIALTGEFGIPWLQPTWSLAIEEQFYLLLPAFVMLTPPGLFKPLLGAGILAALVIRVSCYLAPANDPRDIALFLTPCRGDGLLYGVMLAVIVRETKLPLAPLYAIAIALVVGFMWATFQPEYVIFTLGLTLLGPAFFCVIGLALLHRNGPISVVTGTTILRWLGLRTYAIYLLHMPALVSFRSLAKVTGLGPHWAHPLALLATLAGAALSWRLIEAPLIKLGHKLKYEWSPARSPAFGFPITKPVAQSEAGGKYGD